MELLKDALAAGIKNAEIKEDEGDKDNMSIATVSEYSYSMSQAVFKNTRLPPLFGTKDFASKPYLNLYTEEDANELNQFRNSISANLSGQLPTSPDSGSAQIKRESVALPPPPPPLDQVLSQSNVIPINIPPSPMNIPSQQPLAPPPPLDVVLGLQK